MLNRPFGLRARRALVGVLLLALLSTCARTREIPRPQENACALPDSDGDGLPDVWEIAKYRTDPFSPDSDGDGIPDSDWRERREFTYTVRAILEVAVPLPPMEELQTLFQDVRLLGRRGDVSELEVVLYPGAESGPGIAKYRIQNHCVLPGFDAPELDEGFAGEMRALADAAPTPDARLPTLLNSLFRQTRRSVPFNAFYLSKEGGVVSVEPRARAILSDPDADLRELWDRELDPATMWERRERGECTSSAVLGAAALGAIEVPSRLALFLPLATASQEVLRGIWDRRVFRGFDVRRLSGAGCASHTVVEILDQDRWLLGDEERIRASPFGLGLGPLIQLRTAATLADLVEPELWGAACAGQGPLEGTRNVYRFVHLSDGWGVHARAREIDGIGAAPPSAIELTDVFPFDSPKRPSFIPAGAVDEPARFFLAKGEIDEKAAPALPYFYRCADKSLPPFRFVRGYWGPYFLLEKIGDSLPEDTPKRNDAGCRWILRDTDFAE